MKEWAIKGDVREAELPLQKEINIVQGEIRESELRLQKEIKDLEANMEVKMKSLEIKMMALYGGGFLILLGVLAKGFHWL